jgi:alpha-D-xyloside xylohydrolase
MKQYQWCDFTWDDEAFPDPVGMLRRLHDRGLKVCVWINPYIAQRSPLFAEGARQGYLLKRPDGSVWQTDFWQAGMGIVDFTNPAARDWYCGKLAVLLDQGVDAFKTDFGERIPTDVVYHDGSDPERMHNYYAMLYNQAVFELLEKRRGIGEAVVFARAATSGGQRYPVHWGGDCESTFEAMAQSLRGGLSLGLSGFGFWSHDIGGFEGLPPAALYKRWLAFGLLSSHSRLHGSSSYRVPWLYDEESVDVLRAFTHLKCRLMPYLFGKAVEAHQTGVPVMRPMLVEFPDDPACETLDRQYMLGDSLLVAPVFSYANEVSYYVPAGRWTNVLSGRVLSGPTWARESHGFDSLPLLARPNSVIALGADAERPDYDYAAGLTLRAYELADGEAVTVVIPALDGNEAARFTITRTGSAVTAERSGTTGPWRLQLINVVDVESVQGGAQQSDALGVLVMAEAGVDRLRVVMR